jgi:trigger factor
MILMDSLSQVSSGDDFAAIGEPDLDFAAVILPDDGPLTYEFNIEVRPEFDLPNWRGLSLERLEHQFSAEEIDRAVDEFFGKFSPLTPVDEPVRAGDYLVLNIVAQHDGREVSRVEEETVQVRSKLILSDATVDDFDKLVVGKSAGDRLTTEVQVSEFSDNQEMQGKTVSLTFEILDVKRVDVGDRDSVLSRLGFGSSEEVREFVKSGMESRLAYQQRQQLRKQISQLLTESANWELPPALLRRQSRRELERAVMEMRSSGLSEDEIQTRQNVLRQNVLKRTETLLKEHFILERIAEEEKVQDNPEDYDREIARIALQRNDSPRRIRARLEKSGQMDTLRNLIIEQKVIEMIEQQAKFTSAAYDSADTANHFGLEFFVGGEPGSDIPTAQYDPTANDPFLEKYGDRKERG